MRGRLKSHMGLALAARSSGENGLRHGGVVHAPGAPTARNPHARRWLFGGKVQSGSTSGALRWCRARRGSVGLTGEAVRWRRSEGILGRWRCFGGRRCPRQVPVDWRRRWEVSDEPKRAEKENSVRWQLLPEAGRRRCLRPITSREGGFPVP
jgi:hypothetical protein